MNYIRSLFLNFLAVFFVDRIIPGIEIEYFEQIPNIGADILFSIVVGFLNASIFPFFSLFEMKASKVKLALITLVVSYGAYAIITLIPFGIRAVNFTGFFLGGTLVWAMAFFSNYLEWRHDLNK